MQMSSAARLTSWFAASLPVLLGVITFPGGRGHCCLSLCPVAVAAFHSLFTTLVFHLCGKGKDAQVLPETGKYEVTS